MARGSRSARRIFLSYSHKDAEFGAHLVGLLRRAFGTEDSVWYDDGLVGGDDWWNSIMRELTSRNTFIVLLSPDALKSEYVKSEMSVAWQRHMKKNMQFIPLLYRECKIPKYLRYLNTRQFVSFLPLNDYNISYKKLFKALNINIYDEKLISNTGSLSFVHDMLGEEGNIGYSKRSEAEHVQKMVHLVEESFNKQTWNEVIVIAKALANLYPEAITSSIYELQSLAYIYVDSTEDNRYFLAQKVLESALTLESNPKRRLDLLDVYAFCLIQQDKWNNVANCIDEAERMLMLSPNSSLAKIWQVLREEMPIQDQEVSTVVIGAVNNKIGFFKDMALVLLSANLLFSLGYRLLKKLSPLHK